MAEIAVNLVIDKLGPLLFQEINLLRGVRKEIKDLKIELEDIRRFLKDAEAKAAIEELQGKKCNESVQLWVEQVREVAYYIEDVIDEFAFTVAQLPCSKGPVGVLQKIYRSLKKLKLRCNITNDIQDIKSSLVKIDERRKRYGLNFIENTSSSAIRHDDHSGSYFKEPNQIVGHESMRSELYDLLVNRLLQRRVIVLVGAGGLGKTTVAASVYKNNDVKSNFNCYAWVTVGKPDNKEDLLRKMIRKFYSSMEESTPGNLETMDVIELIEVLRRYLKEKSYIIVFDDIWKVEFWDDVEHALLDNNKSSRIIITTRNKGVANFVPDSIVHIYEIKPLSPNEAWELFCKKAFNSDGICPVVLEELSIKILEKCGGLPLAIVATSGLLSHKNKNAIEWQTLLKNLASELGKDAHLKGCNRVLSESYNDLPHHLKRCLLYFGLFPEDYSISIGKLKRFWIAEGFVQHTNKILSEQVANAYLTELIQRGLIQVSETYQNGRIKRCQVHDLMHDIILRKAEEIGFGQVLNEHVDTSQQKKTRRIAIHTSNNNVLESIIIDSKVRSVFVFSIDEHPNSFMRKLVSSFKFLQVLVFEDAPLDHVPVGLGNLFHLHYLSLRKTKVKILPKSIGNLLNLESLDLRETSVRELPLEIKNLKKLRCLLIYNFDIASANCGKGIKLPKGFGSSMHLQKLSYVLANSKVLKMLKNLRQLRHLGINLDEGTGEDLLDCIANMENLEQLYLELGNREMILDIQSMASFPQYLERLYLVGNLKKLPNWISNLQNLFRLELNNSNLTEDPMRVLHTLPNLLELMLCRSYNGEQLHIKEGWFPKLKELYLINLKGLKFIKIEDGAMPLLECLGISACPLLKEIPTGTQNLRNLKNIIFRDMLMEIRLNSTFVTHETLEKLKHVPKVVASGEVDGEWIEMPLKDILAETDPST